MICLIATKEKELPQADADKHQILKGQLLTEFANKLTIEPAEEEEIIKSPKKTK